MMLQSVECSMTIPIMTNYKAIETAIDYERIMMRLLSSNLNPTGLLAAVEYRRKANLESTDTKLVPLSNYRPGDLISMSW